MSTFVSHFGYTAAAWSKLIDQPGDRTSAVRATIADAGGDLQALYFATDDLSGLALFEAPDEETAMAISMIILGSGAFTSVRTQRLVSGADLPGVLGRAHDARAGYIRPGE